MSTPFSINPNLFLNPNPNPPQKPHSLSSFKIKCKGNNNNSTPPIAPWMKTHSVEYLEKTKTPPKKPDNSLTEKVSGARGKRAMKEILRGIDKLDKTHHNPDGNLAKDESFGKIEENMHWERKEGILRGIGEIGKIHENPDGDLVKDGSFDRFGEKMHCEGENRGLAITKVRIENEKTIRGISEMDKTRKNSVGDLAKDVNFSRFEEKMPWEGGNQGSEIAKVGSENDDILRGISEMGKNGKNPDGNLAKDESFGRFGEKMAWVGKNKGLAITKVRIEKENILRGISKMDKTRKNSVEDSAKDESFSRFGEKMPWVGENKGLVIAKVRIENENILRGISEMDKTGKNPFGNLAKDESFSRFRERMPWEGEDRGVVIKKVRRVKEPTAAKLRIDGEVLERLKGEAAKMKVWVKVNKAGVTQDVVDQVRITWQDNELAMMKFEVPLKWNMGRAREIVENKTGGLVVWTKNDTLVVYRGCQYKLSSENSPKMHSDFVKDKMLGISNSDVEEIRLKDSLYVREADRLLDRLGPRFVDWWSDKPLPVNGDLLPEIVPNFTPPFRLCPPHHARAKLSDYELTYLRKLALPLPTHFVLGRNRKLQGLAAAILKLWEKCHFVKIALKWGAMNTSNEEMADELKDLTGGVLLLRNKFMILIYRSKDFLPSGVVDQVVEREMELREFQLEEEAARLKAIDILKTTGESCINSGHTGTLSEYRELQSNHLYDGCNEDNVKLEAEKERLQKQLRNQERKFLILQMKIKKSLHELAMLNSSWRPAENDIDQEMISEEERECFRKIGLKLDSSLVLGRRGIFKGVIEGVYQHWKHREIVKIITMQKLLSQVVYTAIQLESETGGLLVSVDKLKEGHAIILYRGKNHKRPQSFVSPNLLTKREALSRSLEMQRNGSLKFFAYQRQKAISELKCRLADLETRRGDNQRESERSLPSCSVNSMDLAGKFL